MRKPAEFVQHPISFAVAQERGLARAFCRYVCDGDTYDFLVDLGFNTYAYLTVRLRNFNAPELTGENRSRAIACKLYVDSLILNQPVLLKSHKDETTFGRFVADVLLLGAPPAPTGDLASLLHMEGYG